MHSVTITYHVATRLMEITTPADGRAIAGTYGDNNTTTLSFVFDGSIVGYTAFCAFGAKSLVGQEASNLEYELSMSDATHGTVTIPAEVFASCVGGRLPVQLHIRSTTTDSEYYSFNQAILAVLPSVPDPEVHVTPTPGPSAYVPSSRTINGHALTSDIVLAIADLTEDATHRSVTDAEKAAWNAKQPAGEYATVTQLNAEATARGNADTALGGRIDQEISDRQTAISGEVTARDNAISAHNQNNSAHSDIRNLISAEESARETADNGKVDKVTGKGLSTNDLTNELKGQYDSAYTDKHTHDNKDLLDTYNQTNADIADAVTMRHTHGNINVLNNINGVMANDANDKLANQSFVNSSIEAVAAYYITSNAAGDPFQTHNALVNAQTYYSGGSERLPTRNDYAIVLADETRPIYSIHSGYTSFTTTAEYVGTFVDVSNVKIFVTNDNKDSLSIIPGTTIAYDLMPYPSTRYTYQNTWQYQYTFNMQYTDAQMKALNSGITSTKVSIYDGYQAQINEKQDQITDQNKLPASKVSGLATVATSGSYNDLTNKPTIPTIPDIVIDGGGSETGKAITSLTVDATDKHKINATKGTFLTQHQALPSISITESGSGNVVTGITALNHAITVTKGSVQTSTNWGGIGGTLSNQTDLQNALNAKASTATATTSSNGLMSSTDKTNVNANTSARHTHNNKSTLDNIEGTATATTLGIDTVVTSGSNNLITSGAVYTVIGNIEATLQAIRGV